MLKPVPAAEPLVPPQPRAENVPAAATPVAAAMVAGNETPQAQRSPAIRTDAPPLPATTHPQIQRSSCP
jgi:hypothetical protein